MASEGVRGAGGKGMALGTLAWGAPKPGLAPSPPKIAELAVDATLPAQALPVPAATAPLAAPDVAPLDATVASPLTLTIADDGPPPVAATTLARTTVLPRVAMVGSEPTLVRDQRLRYEPKKLLGEGGIGEVMSVEDHDIGRMAAMKRLRADVRSPAAIARFVDEIRTVGRLEHPNIIPIHDVGVDEQGELYFVMKYLDGETLETILEKLAAGEVGYHSRYGFETRMQIFRGLLEAVAFAHARGVLHRDIKPANVMIGRYGEVVLMDWGIAKPIAGEGPSAADYAAAAPEPAGDERARLFETQVGSLIGTPAYMAPEQARGERCDARSEVYSLSVLLHEMLTLHHYLADCTTMSELLEGVGKRAPRFPSLVVDDRQGTPPADLSWYVMKGLEKDPAKRYQTVAEMLERLDLRAEGIIPIQCPFTFNRRVTAEWRRFLERHPLAGLLMVASVVLVFGFLSFRGITR